jgi:hypothetical protein
MKILTREQWGAAPPKWRNTMASSSGVFIHYNGPAVSAAVLAGDYNSVTAFLRSTQSYHQRVQNWPDIAYSFAVDSVGRIWELRGWGVVGAHTLDWNHRSHAIFLPLGDNQAPTAEQLASCREVIAAHDARYGRGFVKGHQQAPNSTSCPGGPTMARINAGDFDPYRHTTPSVPTPEGADDNMPAPVMMRDPSGRIEIFYRFPQSVIHEHPNGTLWMLYPGTPYRVQVRRDDLAALEYMGIKRVKVDQATANWFWSYNVRQAPPRMYVRTFDDVARFQFFGIALQNVTAEQASFFRRYSQLLEGLTR